MRPSDWHALSCLVDRTPKSSGHWIFEPGAGPGLARAGAVVRRLLFGTWVSIDSTWRLVVGRPDLRGLARKEQDLTARRSSA
jgi:hypothetical protein